MANIKTDEENNRDSTSKGQRNEATKASKQKRNPFKSVWNWTGFGEKKLWDWMVLALMPCALLFIPFQLQEFAKQREQQSADIKSRQEQQVADSKAKQETLTTYLNGMSELIQKGLSKSNRNSALYTIAQANTVMALQSLDPARQHLVFQFLEANTLNSLEGGKGLLLNAHMSKASLNNADLSGSKLVGVDLSEADLSKSNISGANLSQSHLLSTNLTSANMTGSNLTSATLYRVNLKSTNLSLANLSTTYLLGSNLTGANLSKANFTAANLAEANLAQAILYRANLSKAILLSTDLRSAKYLSREQLEGIASPLLCKTLLPQSISINPDRDCATLPQVLLKRYPNIYKNIELAKSYVNSGSSIKFYSEQ